MKNKKIISLVCALAMVFSMFSAFTVANAAVDKGIELAGTLSKDGKTLTIDAAAKGMDAELLSFGIKFAVPESVTDVSQITYTAGAASGTWTPTLVNGIYTLSFFNMTPVAFTDGKLATIVIDLGTELRNDYELKLDSTAMIQDTTNGKLAVSTGMSDAAVTVPKWQDPNKKPDTVPRPGENTDPEEPSDVPVPVPVGEKGIDLAASLNKDNTVLTVEAKAKGMDAELLSFGIKFAAPEGVTDVSKITYTAGAASGTWTPTLVNGIYTLSFFNMTPVAFTDGKLATIVIELPAPAAKAIAVTLESTAMIQDTTNGKLAVSTGTMAATSAVAIPNSGSTVKPTTYALKNYVGKGYTEAIAAVPEGETVYMTVDVTNAGGAAAEYGTDYDAEYPAGVKLTKKQFENLIHGYTDDNIVDVINGLKINVYNSANASKIKTTLNATNQESQLVDPVDTNFVTGPAPSAKSPKLTVTSTKSKANPGDKVTVTTKLTNPGTDGKLTVKTTSDSLDVVTRSGIKVVAKDGTETELAAGTEAEIDVTDSLVFTAALKGSVVLTYNYTCTNNLGEADQIDKPIVKEIKIEEKKTPGPGGSSSDDDDNTGMGPIAGGNLNPGVGNGSAFTDVADVPWALEAITVLSSKGIINGRDTYTFDPNANITRAEYCQILIGAIDKTQEAADSSFDDVASDAWYYHAVSVASKYGIVSGYGDGNFGPSDLITRQDMALMTMKAAQVMNKDLTAKRTLTFADAGQISDYASEAVSTLANAGIINGVSDTEFAPKANATRAQAAVILYQTFVKAN